MAAGGWAPIDSGPGDDRHHDQRLGGAPSQPPGAPPPPPPPVPPPSPTGPPVASGRFTLGWQAPPARAPVPPPAPLRVSTGPRRRGPGPGTWAVLGTLAVVAAVLVGTFTVLLTGDDDAPAAAPESGSETEAASDTDGPVDSTTIDNPSQAFAKAVRQLQEGGSFRYSGVVHATEATALRPTTVFPEPVAVEGEVVLPHRVHELASDGSDTVHESVVVGPGFWERTNSVDAGPDAAPPYGEGHRGAAMDMGAALLPWWLDSTTDRAEVDAAEARALGADEDLRLFRGSLALDEVTGAVEVFVALDPDDVFTRVWIASAEAPFFVDWEIWGVGDPIDIPVPGEQPHVAVGVGLDDLAAAGIPQPVHLTQVPAGWVLADAWIEPDTLPGTCPTLNLDYHPLDEVLFPDRTDDYHADAALELDVMAASCAPTEPLGAPFAVGGFTGEALDREDIYSERTSASLTDGVTTIAVDSQLSLADVEVLLGSLAPFDSAVQPTEVEGLG